MKTLSITVAILFAFGTMTFAQNVSSTTKTSATKTTAAANVKKHYHNCPKAINKNRPSVSGTAK
jgi:hypothetical protein